MSKKSLFQPTTPRLLSGLHYIGGGWLPGVPARDLTPQEAERHGRDILLMTGYYVELPVKQAEQDGD